MRVLFSCTAGEGHFRPLLPLARAFAAAGDDVAFATTADTAAVESSGFRHLPAGIGTVEVNARFAPKREQVAAMPPHERRPFVFTWRFAEIDARAKIDELHAAASAWAPDLIVYESADLSAPIVAASLGVPAVHHGFGRMVPVDAFALAAESTAPLWRARGLEPPPLNGAFEGVYIDICPPSFQTNLPPAGTQVELLRPVSAAPQSATDPPTVYVTLGTAFNDLALFRVLLGALADVDCAVIATRPRSARSRRTRSSSATSRRTRSCRAAPRRSDMADRGRRSRRWPTVFRCSSSPRVRTSSRTRTHARSSAWLGC